MKLFTPELVRDLYQKSYTEEQSSRDTLPMQSQPVYWAGYRRALRDLVPDAHILTGDIPPSDALGPEDTSQTLGNLPPGVLVITPEIAQNLLETIIIQRDTIHDLKTKKAALQNLLNLTKQSLLIQASRQSK